MGRNKHQYGAQEHTHSADRAIQALADRHHGVVSRAQLVAAGITRREIQRRLEAGWLRRLHRGVYAVGHTALTADAHLIAAVYACGPDAVASHRSAARLWGILRGSQPIEVTAARSRAPGDGVIVHRTRCLAEEDRTTRNGIPVTSVARTLLDLADVLTDRRFANAVREAEILRLFDLHELERALERVPGRTGRHRLARVLAAYRDVEPFTRSEAERLVLALCEDHGLPRPQVNLGIEGHEVDFFWPEAALVLEFDGAAAHLTRRAFHEDRARDRDLATKGIHVVRATWRDVSIAPLILARELGRIMAVRRRR